MRKISIFTAFALLSAFSLTIVSCSESSNDSSENNPTAGNYKVKLPSTNSDLKVEQLTAEEQAKLKSKGYNFVGTPVNVTTKDGGNHVVLDDLATVSFDIPADFPKENYNHLVGVIITDDGPEYVIPDVFGLEEGVVRFKTCHFCTVGAADKEKELRKLFIERTALTGWNDAARESDYNKIHDKIKSLADEYGFGKDDPFGIAFREVLGDNEFVKDAMSMIDAYDEGSAPEKAAEILDKKINAKVLSCLFNKLKANPDNEAIVDCLKEHLTQDNVEKVSTRLGNGENAYVVAYEYVHKYGVEKLKDLTVKLVPYVKTAQLTYKGLDIVNKCLNSEKMIYLYSEFEKLVDDDGVLSDDDWSTIEATRFMSSPQATYGMTASEIKALFLKRYKEKSEINKKKEEIEEVISMWEKYDCIKHPVFKEKGFDYIQRLTRLHMLTERFRKELVIDGVLKNLYKGRAEVNEDLAWVVYNYLDFYQKKDFAGFEKWLAENGYYDAKLKQKTDRMDAYRSWWLVSTELNVSENTDWGDGSYTLFRATETQHSYSGMGWGAINEYFDGALFPINFTSSIEAPPVWIEGGDSIVLHCSIERVSDACPSFVNEYASLTFEDADVGWGYISNYAYRGVVTNLTGDFYVGTRPDAGVKGSWDFKLYIPIGRKDDLKAINYSACGSRTHWVYRWCSVFEKDIPIE